jgi:hypothetical protein
MTLSNCQCDAESRSAVGGNRSEAGRAHGPALRQGRSDLFMGDIVGALWGRRAQSVFRWRRSVDEVGEG